MDELEEIKVLVMYNFPVEEVAFEWNAMGITMVSVFGAAAVAAVIYGMTVLYGSLMAGSAMGTMAGWAAVAVAASGSESGSVALLFTPSLSEFSEVVAVSTSAVAASTIVMAIGNVIAALLFLGITIGLLFWEAINILNRWLLLI